MSEEFFVGQRVLCIKADDLTDAMFSLERLCEGQQYTVEFVGVEFLQIVGVREKRPPHIGWWKHRFHPAPFSCEEQFHKIAARITRKDHADA